MDRSMQSKKAALVQRIESLDEQLEQHYEAIETTKKSRVRALDELRVVERAIKVATPTEGATVRDVIRRLEGFTLAELCSQLPGVPAERVKRHLDSAIENEMVKQNGKAMGRPFFEFVAPTQAGDAFERQQERRQQEESQLVDFVREAKGEVASQGAGWIRGLPKQLREVCEDALDHGWSAVKTGRNTYALQKDGASVQVHVTPRDADMAAVRLKNNLRRGGTAGRVNTNERLRVVS